MTPWLSQPAPAPEDDLVLDVLAHYGDDFPTHPTSARSAPTADWTEALQALGREDDQPLLAALGCTLLPNATETMTRIRAHRGDLTCAIRPTAIPLSIAEQFLRPLLDNAATSAVLVLSWNPATGLDLHFLHQSHRLHTHMTYPLQELDQHLLTALATAPTTRTAASWRQILAAHAHLKRTPPGRTST